MGRMLDALKALDAREPHDPEPQAAAPPATPPASLVDWEALDDTSHLLSAPPLELAADELEFVPPAPAKPVLPAAHFETCQLPLAVDLEDCYLEMAARIGEQTASNYSNVLLLVGADRWTAKAFSMVHLAQALSVQSPGDILLVDGELREGELSRQVARRGPGMVEAMLGQVAWPEIIHPTQLARIDFVARGNAQVPTVERPEFGWGALRPLYRAVLIGLARQSEPETNWLAARCDAVYYVLSRPHTRRSSGSAAVNMLRSAGANVAGCIVVND